MKGDVQANNLPKTNVDIGVRIQHRLAERWTMVGYADYGGFGVGIRF